MRTFLLFRIISSLKTTTMGPKTTSAPGKQNQRSKKKSPPKPPLSVSDQLKRLFTSLCAQIDGGHFKNGIRTCDKSASQSRSLFDFHFTHFEYKS